MKTLTFLLLLTVVVGTVGLMLKPGTVLPDFPDVDLSLLEDQVSIRAVQELQQTSDRSRASDWKRLGEYYLAFGFYPQAEICFRVVTQLDDEDKRVLLLHALSLDRMGAKRLAIDAYRRAIEARAPTAKDFRIRIAQCLLTLGEDEQAVKELRRISERPDAQLLLSRILIRRDEIGEALQILLALQQRLPDYVEPFSMYSFAALQGGDVEASRDAQNRSLRCDKNMISSQLLRADELERRGRNSSLIYYEASLELEAKGDVAARARRAKMQ